MTENKFDSKGIQQFCLRYRLGEYNAVPGLTPDEKAAGPDKLREYIRVASTAGEQGALKIANSATGRMREYEQILRPKAGVPATVYFDLVVDFKVSSLSVFEPVVLWPGA